jgi:hypothetical protein
MPGNLDNVKDNLRGLLKSRGYNPEMYDSSGKSAGVPEEAELVQFTFQKDNKDYGPVTIGLDGTGDFNVYFDERVADSPSAGDEDDLSWTHLLNHLKRFATSNGLTPVIKDMDDLKYDMQKRQYSQKEGLREGYHAMSKKQSFNDVIPETKIIIKHSRNMEEGEQRFRQVESIFIETAQGERFKAPTTKPGIAQIYARHIAEGGLPHDERWDHIKGLCEEYTKMAGFVRATHGKQFNESAQKLVTEGLNHYIKLRECLSKMRGKKGYNNYFESWTPPLMEDEVTEDLADMFKNSSLDPRIESVMPILSKLNKNITETVMNEVTELEEWADQLTTEHAADGDPEPGEAVYDDEYQQQVKNVGKKAKERQHGTKTIWVPNPHGTGGRYKVVPKEKEVEEAGPAGVPGDYFDTEKVHTGKILGNKPQTQHGLRGKLVGESDLASIKRLSGL